MKRIPVLLVLTGGFTAALSAADWPAWHEATGRGHNRETCSFIEAGCTTKPEPNWKRGTALADPTRPAHFPHRI